ncbi:MAG: NifB/NifX family molybdenum-iron cluster-binding protein [Nitrospirota bacterium]
MNIAVSTIDGKTICGHLGKCRDFIIYETEGKEIKNKRLLSTGGACPGHGEGETHTHNVSPFDGCGAVITQGMGQGMMDGLINAGIKPVITKETDPDIAVSLYLGGALSGTKIASCSCA